MAQRQPLLADRRRNLKPVPDVCSGKKNAPLKQWHPGPSSESRTESLLHGWLEYSDAVEIEDRKMLIIVADDGILADIAAAVAGGDNHVDNADPEADHADDRTTAQPSPMVRAAASL